jgi:hypothetical protein
MASATMQKADVTMSAAIDVNLEARDLVCICDSPVVRSGTQL